MKKFLSMMSILGVLVIPAQGAFAWSYEGPNSLNPFTGFQQCNTCVKIKKVRCKKPKLTKCQKLNGVKLNSEGMPCGCAAPIQQPQCVNCQRAF